MNYRDVDEAVELAGGRFAFAVLLQKRVRELVRGARPLVEPGRTHIDTALAELRAKKIRLTEPPEGAEVAEAPAEKAPASSGGGIL